MALFPRGFLPKIWVVARRLGAGCFLAGFIRFLHGGWSHCLINLVWLLAFGAPVARRLGARRFLALYLACIVAGGLVQIFSAGEEAWLVPIIGASAGVSGMMGAAARFAFPETRWLDPATTAQRRRLLPILKCPNADP